MDIPVGNCFLSHFTLKLASQNASVTFRKLNEFTEGAPRSVPYEGSWTRMPSCPLRNALEVLALPNPSACPPHVKVCMELGLVDIHHICKVLCQLVRKTVTCC